MPSAYHGDNWRPGQKDRSQWSSYTSTASFSQYNDYQMDWDERNDRAVDQIAPGKISTTTSDLQRWAQATADITQQGYFHNERHIIDRVRRRYDNGHRNPNAPFPRYDNTVRDDRHAIDANNSKPGQDAQKRKRSLSPRKNHREAWVQSEEAYLHDAKRRRQPSPSSNPRDADIAEENEEGTAKDSYYDNSSEWSFPSGEDEGKSRSYKG